MLAWAQTDIGMVRETNEDSFVCQPPLFLVADGMGGHVAGEVASRLAAETIAKHIAASAAVADYRKLLAEAIGKANTLIHRMALENSDYAGMGTTVTAAFITGSQLVWGHVGDSRLYLLRAGELRQLTEDHSLVGELLKKGSITTDEALQHPHRNILTRAVGTNERTKVDTGCLALAAGDRLLLCTDGLTNMVDDEAIKTLMAADGDGVADELVSKAKAAGGLDNITALVVAYGGD